MHKPSSNGNGAESAVWDLSELYRGTDDPRIAETLDRGKNSSREFQARYKGKLACLSPAELRTAFERLEAIYAELSRLHSYANLLYSVDTSSHEARALVERVDTETSGIENLLVFFNLELGALSEGELGAFLGSPEVARYAYYLDAVRRNRKYRLSEKEEQIIILKRLSGVLGFRKLYNDLTSSFQFELQIDGEFRKLNGSQLRSLNQHPDADVRRRALKMYFDRYSDNALVLTSIYTNIVKDHEIERTRRGYASPISVMNAQNDLDDTVVATLQAVTAESYPLVRRYYGLKARLLGMDRIALSDTVAPLPETSRAYSFDEAKRLVLEAIASFDADFHDMAKDMFDRRHVDAPVRPAKLGGAYCASPEPRTMPWVFLNHTGKSRDVATMAHELGHAVHSLMCRDLTFLNFHPTLPLAETASNFFEMVLTDRFLRTETDARAKMGIVAAELEDCFASNHRQNMFSHFEQAAHAAAADHLPSPEELCRLYRHELDQMFGDSVRIPDEYQWEWSSVPHFHATPFYVYAYNFGNFLVMALYEKYMEEGRSFVPRYKKFLAMGGSARPADIAATMDIDIADAAFWRKSLVHIGRRIDELSALVEKATA